MFVMNSGIPWTNIYIEHIYIYIYIALQFMTTFQLSSWIIFSKSPSPSRLLQFAKFSLQGDLTFWTKNTPFKVKPQQQKNSAFLLKGSSWDFLPYQKKKGPQKFHRSVETSSTRWFKVTFYPLFGGHLTIPKRSQRIARKKNFLDPKNPSQSLPHQLQGASRRWAPKINRVMGEDMAENKWGFAWGYTTPTTDPGSGAHLCCFGGGNFFGGLRWKNT